MNDTPAPAGAAARATFRNMTPSDVPLGLSLCRACRWNQLARDWELFLRLSPRGCRVAEVEGKGVGTATTLRYQDRFGWVSMLLVDPAHRGQGIGTQLLLEALSALSDMKTVRLDATPAGYPIYGRHGFVEEFRLRRMENLAVSGQGLESAPASVRPLTRADLPAVAELDHQAFGADRREVLLSLFDGAPEYAWVLEEDGRIEGFTLGRHGFAFEQLGPVVTAREHVARALASACLARHTGKPFILDAPDHSPEWLQWLQQAGFREQRPFIRMRCGPDPSGGRLDYLFAIAGPELG